MTLYVHALSVLPRELGAIAGCSILFKNITLPHDDVSFDLVLTFISGHHRTVSSSKCHGGGLCVTI